MAAGVIVVLVGAGPACRVEPRAQLEPAFDEGARRQVVARSDRFFDAGFLWKPRDVDEPAASRTLAPLLIEETGSTDAASMRFGALVREPDGTVGVSAEPTVYWRQSSAVLGGRSHAQWTFAWWYANAGGPVLRGIRMTLDDDGFPAVHETLGDSSGARLVFVSPALESAAAAAWGSPLAGRAFAIERPIDEAPDVVVMELVEPGPEPLGPFVYLDAGERDVAALACRCMPSRVADIPDSADYRLVPAADSPEALRLMTDASDARLDRMLRLPPTF